MNALLRRVVLGTMALCTSMAAMPLDLPVKRINGKDMYYYAVRRGDTVYGLSSKLGISRDDIIRNNPSAADGLRQGVTLYFPVSEYRDKGIPGNSPTTDTAGGATFTYKVQRGETLFGLSHRFGTTPDAIIALNPQSNDGIKAGEYLIIPGNNPEAATAETREAAPQPSTSAPQAAPVAAAETVVISQPVADSGTVTEAVAESADTSASSPIVIESQIPTGSIAVLLPLMLDEETPSKQALRATDFVRGLMLAARDMGSDGSPVKINVHDTKGSLSRIASLMSQPEIADADVIIAPDDEASLAAVVKGASPEAYVFNILAVQDTLYLTHDNVVQANIPHDEMYAAAVRGLMETYEGYTPVFLISKGGRSDKLAFTQAARAEYERRGFMPMEIAFEGTLQQRDLEALDPAGKYVFIPGSGSLSEFNKFARALKTYRENSADPSSIALFGYPEWTIYRNEAAELLHSLEATFYSRFYADATSEGVSDFNRRFTLAFGSEPMDVVPSQALLGYDTARYLITDIRDNQGVYTPELPVEYTGLQSAWRLRSGRPDDEAAPVSADTEADNGAINTALYLITYLPGNGVATRIL